MLAARPLRRANAETLAPNAKLFSTIQTLSAYRHRRLRSAAGAISATFLRNAVVCVASAMSATAESFKLAVGARIGRRRGQE
jgi:hypothetical protein